MSGWGGGYVTDIPYSTGWYRHQAPVKMAIAAIIGGARAVVPDGDDPVVMLELGCGNGFTALALAASNPNWRVYAVDYNPTHIATAREWAAQAGLTNVTFIEGDFSTWEDDPAMRDLPEMDFVTMHGIWTWIPPAAQAGIVRLLAKKVTPGGLVHVSYNAATGWVDMMSAARVIRMAGSRIAGRSDAKARAGLQLVSELLKAEAHFLHNRPGVTSRMKMFDGASQDYLAHEFMNDFWAPRYFDEVVEAMGGAKLEWAASSELTENFPELVMSEAQREIFNRFDDPTMRETIKDLCTPRALRQDIFVRGIRRISVPERNQLLMGVTLSLAQPPSELPEKIGVAAGLAELNKNFYGPIVEALSRGARTARELLDLPDLSGRRDNPAELVSILTSTGMAEPAIRPGAEPGVEASRLNAVTVRHMFGKEPPFRPIAAACHATGTPLSLSLFQLIVVDLHRRGITTPEGIMDILDVAPDQTEKTRGLVEKALAEMIPLYQVAGVI